MYKAHVPRVECGRPLAAVAGVDGSGQLLQRPLVVGIELVGQGEMQLLGAGLHGAVCEIRQTGHLDPDVRTARPGLRIRGGHEPGLEVQTPLHTHLLPLPTPLPTPALPRQGKELAQTGHHTEVTSLRRWLGT